MGGSTPCDHLSSLGVAPTFSGESYIGDDSVSLWLAKPPRGGSFTYQSLKESVNMALKR